MERATPVLGLALVALSAPTARAQAPGQLAPQPPAPSVMDRRWAIGGSLGSETLTAKTSDAPHVTFGMVELSGRFRIRPHLEVALSFAGGGAMKGQLSTASLFAEVRYRFFPERPWDPFVLGGLGVASVAGANASDAERKGRGALRLGGGIERRLGRFALEAELRLIGIAHDPDLPDTATPTTEYELARFGVSGLSLSLGATVYF